MTQMANTPGTPAWVVTTQTESTKIGPSGNAQEVMTVGFRLPDGTQGSVDVPLAAYNVANVQTAIAAKAATMQAVLDLVAPVE